MVNLWTLGTNNMAMPALQSYASVYFYTNLLSSSRKASGLDAGVVGLIL
jgi:hypothetical protein